MLQLEHKKIPDRHRCAKPISTSGLVLGVPGLGGDPHALQYTPSRIRVNDSLMQAYKARNNVISVYHVWSLEVEYFHRHEPLLNAYHRIFLPLLFHQSFW